MSWDNVYSVYAIKIWTEYSDSTQGHLFVNDNHQLKLYVGIDFTLNAGTTEGPTDDEVRSAITLVNNIDGGPLKYLTIVDMNSYTAVYDPYHNQAVDQDDTSNVDDGVYDNVITYYVSSPSSVNAEAYSESIALTLEYHGTSSDGTAKDIFADTSAVAEKGAFATYVSVACYPAKLYGNKGENRTCITSNFRYTPDKSEYLEGPWDIDSYECRIFWFYIDDPYFKIFYFDGCNDPDPNISHDPYYIYKDYESAQWDAISNAFFPNIKCGAMDYTVRINVRPDLDQNHSKIAVYDIIINQLENQLTFVTAWFEVKALDYATDVSKQINLSIYDQFGNSAYVVAFSNADDALVKSVS